MIATLVPGAVVRGGARLGPQRSRHRRVGGTPHGDVAAQHAAAGMAVGDRQRVRHRRPATSTPTHPVSQLEPVGLKAVVEVTDRFDPIQPNGFLIVASAGNEDSSRETYPAAFDSVLGVGALDTTVDCRRQSVVVADADRTKGRVLELRRLGRRVGARRGVADEPRDGRGVRDRACRRWTARARSTARRSRLRSSRAMIAEQMSITGLDARDAWELIEAKVRRRCRSAARRRYLGARRCGGRPRVAVADGHRHDARIGAPGPVLTART